MNTFTCFRCEKELALEEFALTLAPSTFMCRGCKTGMKPEDTMAYFIVAMDKDAYLHSFRSLEFRQAFDRRMHDLHGTEYPNLGEEFTYY